MTAGRPTDPTNGREPDGPGRKQAALYAMPQPGRSDPLAIDLYAGLGGWSEGFLAEGYRVVGFDIERHQYGDQRYPGQLVLQDVLTIYGGQFKDAAVIVASPPCQNYSYLAMPWSRSSDPNNSKAAKALRRRWESEGPDNRLFDACFRIQREACLAKATALGCWVTHNEWFCPRCYIPLIVENVRGAMPWVGPSRANYGSFHLWGDVSQIGNRIIAGNRAAFGEGLKVPGRVQKRNPDGTNHPQGSWFRIADSSQGDRGVKQLHSRGDNQTCGKFRMGLGAETVDGQKVPAYSDPRRNGGKGVHLTSPAENAGGVKIGGDWFSDPQSTCRKHGSRSNARKAASATIAKIPLPLSRYIAQAFDPRRAGMKPGGIS